MTEFETKPDGTPFTSSDYSPRHAEVFANRYDDGLGNRKISTFRRLAGRLPGTRVLDVGSGEGTFSKVAREGGAQVVAVDFAEAMVAATAARAAVPVVRGSADALPFDSGHFGVVVALDIIEHLYQPERALAEFRRVLAPGGRLLLGTDRDGVALGLLPLRFPKPVRKVLTRRQVKGTMSDPDRYITPLCTHTHEFELDELLTLTARHGFRTRDVDSYSYSLGLDGWGRMVERCAIGPLRKWKWNYVMVSLTPA
jgi:SAM-dependent methyltransferase